jgi:site-specific DNA-methyltransferase (adenine-specific)
MEVVKNITITNEDNMELMARYPDNYFELAIVDPPYGINADKKIVVKNYKAKNQVHCQQILEVRNGIRKFLQTNILKN